MHVPTGLFVQGHYMAADYSITPATSPAATGVGQAVPPRRTATHWLIQAGIAKNWFGIGNTALYGEYGGRPTAVPRTARAATSLAATAFGGTVQPGCGNATNFTTVNGVTDTELTVWGFGITQNVDAAASTLVPRLPPLQR